MAKLLPCKTCRAPATLPGAVPYYIGQIFEHPVVYACASCKRTTSLTILEYNQIPDEPMPEQPPARVQVKPDLMRVASGEKFVPPIKSIDTPGDVF